MALFCNPASGGTFSSTAIKIMKWVKKFAVAQAKVTHILGFGKASKKTPKGVIPPSLCEITQNASGKKIQLPDTVVLQNSIEEAKKCTNRGGLDIKFKAIEEMLNF
jgi:hypothetical protein